MVEKSRRHLPHWDMEDAVYFCTWRVLRGRPDLTEAERQAVVSALHYFDGVRYSLFSYVVMNDHVHVLVKPLSQFTRSAILHSWKSFTSHEFNKMGWRSGPIWESESFDRIIRSQEEFLEKCQYILNNPQKRWPEVTEYPWVGLLQDNLDRVSG